LTRCNCRRHDGKWDHQCAARLLCSTFWHSAKPLQRRVASTVCVNVQSLSESIFRRLSPYVEADDALIGLLAVKKILHSAAKLSFLGAVSAAERIQRVDGLFQSFDLTKQTNILIGTLVRKDSYTGQKRRFNVAAQPISAPKIVFLDESTSGLGSAVSFKVMSYDQNVAKKSRLIVIASKPRGGGQTTVLRE
jgi:ABC-type multidrug transport system ATPase subunit